MLVAEDEAIIRLDLIEILESEGYDVVAAAGRGDQAADLAIELQPDVAILDIKMPGIDGITAARRISAEVECAIVVLTAYSERGLIDEASSAGVMAYLVKPYQRVDIAPAVELALARFRDLRDSVSTVGDLERQLADRKLIDRAKGHLIDNHSMTEADAFSFLRQSAMSARCRMADVAQEVLNGSLAP